MILITGGAGYIGSHCALALLKRNEKIVIIDNLDNGHIETINALKNIGNVEFIKGDLKNKKDIEFVFKNFDIDTLMHFAGYIQVEESTQNPSKYYENNIIGTINLLNTMVEYNVKKIIFSSTCAIYGEPEYLPIDENHPKNPLNPYGKTKLIIEAMLDDYDKAYDIKSVRLRYFNVAGADCSAGIGEWHQPETHLIPNILKSVFEKEKIFNIFGNDYDTFDGTCIRDYVNVEDLACAHVLALEYLKKENKTECINIGTSQGNSVKEIFDTVKLISGKNIPVEFKPRRAGDAAKLIADTKKARKILNWEPAHSLHDSIKSAYLWEKSKLARLNFDV